MIHAGHQLSPVERFLCCRVSLRCGASLQSRLSGATVLISVPSFTKPDYLQMRQRLEHSNTAAAPAVGFVCFRKTVCRNLTAVRTLIYEDTTAI